MSWSYSGDPEKSLLDQVRFTIGDTDPNDNLLSDEELGFLIKTEDSPLEASISAAETIAAKYSRLADERVGDVSISFKQKAENYLTLASKLKERRKTSEYKGTKVNATPLCGGISRSEKQKQELEIDRVDPLFTRRT